MAKLRADKEGAHRAALAKNKKRIFAVQDTCGICGHPVDKSIKAKGCLTFGVARFTYGGWR